jgi:hypothetical protein
VIGAVAALLIIPVAIINRSYMRRSLMLNEGLNNQLEQEVQAIEAAQERAVTRHFAEVRAWRVKLSDADAFNWTAIEGLSILGFLLVLLRVTYMPKRRRRHHFCDLRLCLAPDGRARHDAVDRPAAHAPQGHLSMGRGISPLLGFQNSPPTLAGR